MRLIDADTLVPKLKIICEGEKQIYGRESWGFAIKCLTAVEDASTFEPERKKGKWIDKSDDIYGAWNYCSVCGEQAIDLYDFCPNCGADMREGEEE